MALSRFRLGRKEENHQDVAKCRVSALHQWVTERIPESQLNYHTTLKVDDKQSAKPDNSNKEPRSLDVLHRSSNYQNVRNKALEKIILDFKQSVDIIINGYFVEAESAFQEKRIETLFRVFSWSLKDFYIRRERTEPIWLEPSLRQYSIERLQMRKQKFDVEEFQKYLVLAVECCKNSNPSKFVTAVNNTRKLFGIEKDLRKEWASNAKLLPDYLNMSSDEELFGTLDRMVCKAIETRCQIGYIREREETLESEDNMKIEALQQQINDIRKKIEEAKYCSECTMNCLYAQVNIYKSYINDINAEHASRFDYEQNHTIRIKNRIARLRIRRESLKEQIPRFREEVEKVRLRSIAKEEQKAETALQQQSTKAKKKPKGKACHKPKRMHN